MTHHEASTTVDVAPNILFDALSDLTRLPRYLPRLTGLRPTSPPAADTQGLEARRPYQPAHHTVEVSADEPSGDSVYGEAWIDVIEENRTLRWGAPGDHDYHGELAVEFIADGTSRLAVRLDTEHGDGQAINDELDRTLAAIKASFENATPDQA
jgi:hypothetical protein